MPTKDTFKCPPIKGFVDYYLRQSVVSIDPFSRNFGGCTYTNDLNPKTKAQYHMKAHSFLEMIKNEKIVADLFIFDPPYTTRQVKECYSGVGIDLSYEDSLNGSWALEKKILSEIIPIKAVFLHFGYHTNGMGVGAGFAIEEILIVAHGGAHNDTICMAERRVNKQDLIRGIG